MTDDIRKDSTCDKTASISKVVRDTANLCTGTGNPEWPHNCDCPKHATTPAEVGDGMVLDPIRVLESEETFLRIVHGDDTANEHMRAVATLARQLSDSEARLSASEALLAEAKERMRELEMQRDDYLTREWVAEKAKNKAEAKHKEAVELLEEALDQMKSDEISLDWEFGSCSLSSESPLEDWNPTIQQVIKYLQENKNE